MNPLGRARSYLREARPFAVTLEDERGVQTPAGAMYLLGTDS